MAARDKVSEAECRQSLAAQMPTATKAKLADTRLDNDGTLEQLHERTDAVLAALRRQARAHVLGALLGLRAQ